jgi:beta-mannosidase
MARIVTTSRVALDTGWEMAETDPNAADSSPFVRAPWRPTNVPGTAAQALGITRDGGRDLDASDYWYKKRIDPREVADVLRFEGLATLAEVWLDGERILTSNNMFREHVLDVSGRMHAGSELAVRFGALGHALRQKRPRPRWRATIVKEQQLRWFRTSLLGRIPAWTPPIAPVGPYRAVSAESPCAIISADVRTRVESGTGIVEATLEVRDDVRAVDLLVGESRVALDLQRNVARGSVSILHAPLWWPHTHGPQARLPVSLLVRDAKGEQRLELGATGFRTVHVDRERGAFTLYVNGARVFCRGACWMPLDVVGLRPSRDELRRALEQARDAGMNMLRISGTTLYESREFHELCDELGILVWQDFMFANMDYPIADEGFASSVTTEAAQVMDRLQLSPSLIVCCGGSEVEQQAAMMGLPREDWSSRLFAEVLPNAVERSRPDVVYIPSSPTGGALPFHVDEGVSHYYGVGAYMRPLDDARRSRVRFTSECLAFANLPRSETIGALLRDGEAPTQHPRWKSRVARDRNTPWDFEDVRDHYLERLFGVDASALRRVDLTRYLELSRVATGEAMATAMTEWRRKGSECAGALVWFLRDLWEGAGWGLVDARGFPKSPYYYLKRVLSPVAMLVTDEGLNGLALHAVNDRATPLAATVSIQMVRGETIVAQGEERVTIPAHDAVELRADAVLGRFTDVTYAYRFGPAGHEATVATLTDTASGAVVGRASHFPQGLRDEQIDVGLEAAAEPLDDRSWRVRFRSRRFAQAVAIEAPGMVADDDFFHVPPGATHDVILSAPAASGTLLATAKALNSAMTTKINHANHPRHS